MPRHWRTDDGDLVGDGHPDARILAYGADDPLEADETVRDDAFDYIPDPDLVPDGLTASGDEDTDGDEAPAEPPADSDEPPVESAVDDVLDSLTDGDEAPAEDPAPKQAPVPRNKARRPTRNK